MEGLEWGQGLRDLQALSLVNEESVATLREVSEQVYEAVLSLWGEDGRDLHDRAESEDVDVWDIVFESLAPEAQDWTRRSFFSLKAFVIEGHNAVCILAPAGWDSLASDAGVVLPQGSLFVSDLETNFRRAWRLPDLAEIDVRLRQAVWEMASPDGRRIVSRLPEGELWMRPSDESSAPMQVLPDAELGCAAWSHDSSALLLQRTFDEEVELIRFDVATEEVAVLQPERDVHERDQCAIQVDDDQLVVMSAADDGVFDVWLTTLDGRRLELLITSDSCTVFPFSPARPGPRVTLVARCRDPHQSGLWDLDLAEETLDHLATGVAGAHSWSADGRWVAFVHAPPPLRWDALSVWIADTATGRSRQVTDAATSWPLLLVDPEPAALP